MRSFVSLRRVGAAVTVAAGLVLVGALPAAAHVTVSTPDAEPGGFGKLVFRVPNESADADTTKLQVQLPTDTPFTSVSTKPMPGWTVETEESRLDPPVNVDGVELTRAITSVTWTAESGGGLPPDQFTEFELSVGPFPEDVDSLSFPTTQTYSDGEVVAWDQPVREGAAEPERPAPTLDLASAEGSAGHSHQDEGTTADAAPAPAADTSSATDDTTARVLGGVAIVLAALALLLALRPRPRKS
jgi:periplasmic copper chaperone A